VILLLHNRYRTTGGEERVVDDFAWLVREHLGEDAEVMERDSAALSRPRAAVAMLRGGLQPDDVAAAVRRTGARIVHAHNVNPSYGWRARSGLSSSNTLAAKLRIPAPSPMPVARNCSTRRDLPMPASPDTRTTAR